MPKTKPKSAKQNRNANPSRRSGSAIRFTASRPSATREKTAKPTNRIAPLLTEQLNVRLTKADMKQLDAAVARLKDSDKNYPEHYTRAFWARVLIVQGLSQKTYLLATRNRGGKRTMTPTLREYHSADARAFLDDN